MDDFSESAYVALVRKAKERFRFIDDIHRPPGKGEVLWRHDVDVSPYQARRLAEIESSEGVCAYYFILLTGDFYNVMEPNVRQIVRELITLGHNVGLHFDPNTAQSSEFASIERELEFQAETLKNIIGCDIMAFTIHNPTVASAASFCGDTIKSMRNLSSEQFREQFTYCSDSNGVWRFRSLWEVIADRSVNSLYALTHPCWWSETGVTPREKIITELQRRVSGTLEEYDALLEEHGRPNARLEGCADI